MLCQVNYMFYHVIDGKRNLKTVGLKQSISQCLLSNFELNALMFV